MYPKVLVFIPYKSPLTGYTMQANLKLIHGCAGRPIPS
jgi:hypothetical protein